MRWPRPPSIGDAQVRIPPPQPASQSAPNPNAARLFQSFLFSVEAQQVLIDACALCSFHALVKEKAGRRPLSTIKLMKTDPVAMEAQRERKSRHATAGFSGCDELQGRLKEPSCLRCSHLEHLTPFGPLREPQWLALPPINLEKLQECLLLVETWRLTAIRGYQIENVRGAVEAP